MQQTINKSEFISNLSANCDTMTDTVVDDAVREILNLMTHTLANDGRVEVRGFGSFCLHHRRARMGRNPKTGESVPVPAKAIPHFKPGKALREAVNEKVAGGQ
ncbi:MULTISPECIES: integration host factor subunit beta [Psychrobacter]|uniref:integration host factor subunit beta n=1 Tax=Psychrobacter TaxID=497 RepID=UPI0005A032AC|nr:MULTISPECIES: integration host factor subunit beta [Psychrobacter]ASE25640.1 integration host factor subunit beta [Psychrobacter cryohalolentis]KAA0929556.1 integration host factor subunit beta [Psychrobacter sp. ANT_H56B]KAA0934905.1 integration host factor subunit beta [Psychrobacter sp. ANT_H59]MBA2057491.1 integration host factor subunit beta [Psychrobacter sp. D2]